MSDENELGISNFGCNDGVDNDFDGYIDSDDEDCLTSYDDTEEGDKPSCQDQLDDDNDGWFDYNDPDCMIYGYEVGFTDFTCNDGKDNDGDGTH